MRADGKPHAVCVPYPAQGHATPMMKLAKVLHSRGFHVTFVYTEHNHRRLVRSRGAGAVMGLPDFRFATIPDGLPPSDPDATQDQASICYSTTTTCLPHLKSLLGDLSNSAAGTPPVTCVVADSIMSFAVDAAAELGVPCALFWTASACGYMGYYSFRFLLDHGLTPLKVVVEQLVPDGDGSSPLAAIRPSLWREDQSCLEWLHGREPRSVVYVNFGSITTMTSQELVEFAWGLANCGYDFLWIVRNDLVKGDAAVLPPEFLEATKGRCLLASWCEQEAVLRHEAVGIFLTHYGWNSMMEGLSSGLPMLGWPFFAEQQTNCRYTCVEWGVGMEVGDDVRREVVEERIREVMGDSEVGREMRRKAVEWKNIAVHATVLPDGRSLANLERLLKDVLCSPQRNAV
ncbi:unnamed protein product [Triticum turgidum subsp. durum]|uniref:Glycosyltransferase N-terminal domain-containing protein n=1 Tax=Triticum turgidum subsp. durum TaxID=4567 RepID=A0A9R1R129_TRITD|nr:unnamed protein product [Triticum turgidum subsp. durum]